jgi:hypothetical protein
MNGTAANYLAGQLSIGTTSLNDFVNISNSTNGVTRVTTTNNNAGTSTQVQYQLSNGTHTASLGLTGTAFPSNLVFLQGGTYLTSGNSAGGLLLNTGAVQPIYFGINNAEVARFGTNGSLGIGATNLTAVNLFISKTLTGGVDSYHVNVNGIIQSDVTSSAFYFRSSASTAAASFTLSNLFHYVANQGGLGAGSSVGTQTGFQVNANLIGATTNYGFRGQIPSGVNRWNLFLDGTASNYMLGNTGIGIIPSYKLDVQDSNIAGIANVASFSVIGNGAAGRGVGILIGSGGSSNSVQVARLVGYQETTSATATAASFAIQVANSSGTLTEYLRINNTGSIGIGTTSLTGYDLRISSNITGATVAYGVSIDGQVQTDVTSTARYFQSVSNLAASVSVGGVNHFRASQGTFGSGAAITNAQVGFFADAGLIGGVNNYGFQGSIAAGTNRWNLFMDGTANNYMAGSLGIGTTTLTGINLNVSKTITGASTSYGIANSGAIQSDVSNGHYFVSSASTAATAFTLPNLYHYRTFQGTFGAGSTVTNQFGFYADVTQIGATNNYGFYGAIASGTNRWNLYMAGTAANYMAGSLAIGTTSITTKLSVITPAGGNTSGFSVGSTNGLLNIWGGSVSGVVFDVTNGTLNGATGADFLFRQGGLTSMLINSSQQVGIGSGLSSVNASAQLQVDSTTRGFLPPRMTTTQKLAIGTPAAGLMVYDTTLNQMSYYNGTTWINF